MNANELDELLRQTLSDHKLSGSEKQTLTGFLQKQIRTEQDRGVARSRAFEVARQIATDEEARRVLSWMEDVLKVIVPVQGNMVSESGASVACFSPGDECLGMIINRFSTARRTADICVFTITDDRIARAILDSHRRGVRIRIITDNEKAMDPGSDVERLQAAGIPLKVDHTPYHMHHKFAIFDGIRLLNGSYNWTRGAANDNEENIIDIGDAKLIAAFQEQFETLWEKL